MPSVLVIESLFPLSSLYFEPESAEEEENMPHYNVLRYRSRHLWSH